MRVSLEDLGPDARRQALAQGVLAARPICPKRSAARSELEDYLDGMLRAQLPKLGTPLRDYRFAAHPEPPLLLRARKWELDRAWPDIRVAVEVQGGTRGKVVRCHACGVPVREHRKDGSVGGFVWTGGRHVQGTGYEHDREKLNMARALGWYVLEVTSGMLRRDMGWLRVLSMVAAHRMGGTTW